MDLPLSLLAEGERIVGYVVDGPRGRRTVEPDTSPLTERPPTYDARDCAYCGEPFVVKAGDLTTRDCSAECRRLRRR